MTALAHQPGSLRAGAAHDRANPMRRLGEVAIEILFDRYERVGLAGPREVLLPPELVILASCP